MGKNRFLGALVFSFLVSVSGTLLAADAAGKFAVKGVARTTCEHFTKAYDEQKDRPNAFVLYTGWLEGYLSALNERTEGTYDLTSFESTSLLTRLVYLNCQRDVSIPFFNVVRRLAAALNSTRIATFSDMVPVEGKVELEGQEAREIKLMMYAETIRRVQNNLTSAGYFSDPVDGVYGESTRAAMREYQVANSLTVTGLPDQFTLLKLLRQPRAGKGAAGKSSGTGG